jgi:hypothetical protein
MPRLLGGTLIYIKLTFVLMVQKKKQGPRQRAALFLVSMQTFLGLVFKFKYLIFVCM